MFFSRNEFDADTKVCYTDLYNKEQKIQFRVGGRDEKLLLNVRVSLNVRFGFTDEKILKVVVTDPSNPLLLFSTEINSDTYSKLKQKLGLLIDFSQFPQQLVALLAQCSSDADPNAKYLLFLEELNFDPYDLVEGRCILFRIMEINQFQRLCLVALHMICGTESEINAFLARNIRILKKQIENMNLKVQEAEEKVSKASEMVEAKNFEVEELRSQCNEKVRSVRQDCDEEVAKLKHEIESTKNDFEMRTRKALHEQEEKFISHHKKLQEVLEKTKIEMDTITNSKLRLEAELAEKNDSSEHLHGDLKILQDEILKYENKLARLETDAKEKNMFVVSLKQRIAYLEKDKEDKDKAIKKLTSLLEAADSQKNVIKSTLKEKLHVLETQRSDLSMMRKDLLKANEIIAKLNKEISELQTKLAERSKIALEQEKLISELRRNLTNNEDGAKQNSGRLKELEEENVRLIELLKENEELLKSKDDAIQKNERVIGWLQETVCKLETKSKTNLSTTRVPSVVIDPKLVDKKLSQITNSGVVEKSKWSSNKKTFNVNSQIRNK
jgi:hypothetical protein